MEAREAGQQVEEIDPRALRSVNQIGRGSTGEVLTGVWGQHEVAIKQIHDPWGPEASSSPYTREVNALSRAIHPNVVRLLGVVSASQPLCIILELCRGGSCAEFLYSRSDNEEKPLTWAQTFRIAKDTSSAMHYLHTLEPPLIHRDLKSHNLLLERPICSNTDVPITKVCDFGVSRFKADGEEGMTARATDDDWPIMTKAVGTCNWVAPEVFRGHTYDERIDVYAFGMVLFELVFHEMPFEDLDPIEITALVTQGRRPSLEEPPPSTPPEILHYMQRCWSHHPDLRPPFSELQALLEPFPG